MPLILLKYIPTVVELGVEVVWVLKVDVAFEVMPSVNTCACVVAPVTVPSAFSTLLDAMPLSVMEVPFVLPIPAKLPTVAPLPGPVTGFVSAACLLLNVFQSVWVR